MKGQFVKKFSSASRDLEQMAWMRLWVMSPNERLESLNLSVHKQLSDAWLMVFALTKIKTRHNCRLRLHLSSSKKVRSDELKKLVHWMEVNKFDFNPQMPTSTVDPSRVVFDSVLLRQIEFAWMWKECERTLQGLNLHLVNRRPVWFDLLHDDAFELSSSGSIIAHYSSPKVL